MGTIAIASAIMARSPKGYWKQDEASGFFQDSSGNGKHMTNGINNDALSYRDGGAGAGPGSSGYCVRWVPTYTEVSQYRSGVCTTVQDNWTLLMFMKFHNNNGRTRLFGNGAWSGGDGWAMCNENGGGILGLANGIAFQSAGSSPTVDAWCLVGITRESGTWKYYKDGSLSTSNAGSTNPNAPSTGVQMGYVFATQDYRSAHLAVFDTALVAADFTAINDAAAVDDTTLGFVPKTVMFAEADEPDRRRLWTPRGLRLPRPRIIVPELA